MASGLQVDPVSLTLQPQQMADGLWLSNVADQPLFAQVRVYHWTQADGSQQLVPSQGLVISPPLLKIAPGDKQLIRVIRLGAPPAGANAAEDTYRLAIDELPVASAGRQHGLKFVLHYSIPIFIEPQGKDPVQPHLHWALVRDGKTTMMEVSNSGNGHAQLAAVHLISHGRSVAVTEGLLGYVLPGAMMRFALRQPASFLDGSVAFEAAVNGSTVTQDAALADPTR